MRRSLGALGALGSLSARKVGLVASPDEARSASVADDDADRGVGAMCVRALDDGSEELVVLRGDGVVVRWSIGDDLAHARVAAIHEARAGEPGGLGALFGTPGAGGASATWAPCGAAAAPRGLPLLAAVERRRGTYRVVALEWASVSGAAEPAAGDPRRVARAARRCALDSTLVGELPVGSGEPAVTLDVDLDGADVHGWVAWPANLRAAPLRIVARPSRAALGDVVAGAALGAVRKLDDASQALAAAGAAVAVAAPPHAAPSAFLRGKRALLQSRGLVVLAASGDCHACLGPRVAVDHDRPQQSTARRGDAVDWAALVGDLRSALGDEERSADALEALGAAARDAPPPQAGLCAAAVDASASVLAEAPACGFHDDDDGDDVASTLVLRHVEQRKATHAKLILALADAGKCLDAAAVDALADGAAFAEAAVAAARLHARMLQTPDMAAAGDLVSKACGDAVARRGDDAARRRAGLSVLDAFYGAAPAESLAGLIGALGAARTLEDGAAKARVAVHAATAARAAVAAGAAAYGDALAALGGGGARDAVWRGGGPACRAALGGLRDLAFDPSGGLAAARDARTVALELAELLVGGTAGAEGDGALVVTSVLCLRDSRDFGWKRPASVTIFERFEKFRVGTRRSR